MRLRTSLAWGDTFRRWAFTGLDLIFPPICPGCGRPGRLICPECAQRVEPVPATICRRCGHVQDVAMECCSQCAAGPYPLFRVRAAGLHVEPLRTFIHLLKYEGRPDLAPPLARYLVASLARPDWDDLRTRFDAVAPIPLHGQRRRERGYNQSELLAAELCRYTRQPLRTDLLLRTKFTHAQVGLTAGERRANVADAFTASPACAGLRMLLIDDVYTTGATMAACAQAAIDAGATLICALTLAIPAP